MVYYNTVSRKWGERTICFPVIKLTICGGK